ncbi:MAG: hypothetical protein P1P93_06240 [Gammaproteobacteria bacterium]|nr:hypothetical protein [Gammaproteobacteria bacterium]
MTIESKLLLRLQFLTRVIRKESQHLATTDQRLFSETTSIADFSKLDSDIDLAERVEAFVSRFCRLQDTLGDKLLPILLTALGEKTASVIDNLDRAERLSLIASAEEWMTMRHLRNQMVHEYVEDNLVLTSALKTGHLFVSTLIATANTMINEIERRGWA